MLSEGCIVFSYESHWLFFNQIILMRGRTFLLVSTYLAKHCQSLFSSHLSAGTEKKFKLLCLHQQSFTQMFLALQMAIIIFKIKRKT